jgi:hypothetical protein
MLEPLHPELQVPCPLQSVLARLVRQQGPRPALRPWWEGRPWRWMSAALLLRLLQCCHGGGTALEGAGQEHRRLEVGRGTHRDVHSNMFWETADEELHLLAR